MASYDDWVWWPNREGTRSRAEEEFFRFPPRVRGEFLDVIARLLVGERRFKEVRELRQGVKELKVRFDGNQYRVLFFITGRVCVGLTCHQKQKQKAGEDLDRAISRMKSYRGS